MSKKPRKTKRVVTHVSEHMEEPLAARERHTGVTTGAFVRRLIIYQLAREGYIMLDESEL